MFKFKILHFYTKASDPFTVKSVVFCIKTFEIWCLFVKHFLSALTQPRSFKNNTFSVQRLFLSFS